MSGFDLKIEIDGIDVLAGWAARINDAVGAIPDAAGAMIVSQTQRRIENERTGPDGTPWPAWSEAYARTRHGGHNLLQNEGDLVDSLNHIVSGEEVSIGSPLIYAATHQMGRDAIPARPFLGLSPANLQEIEQMIADMLEEAADE